MSQPPASERVLVGLAAQAIRGAVDVEQLGAVDQIPLQFRLVPVLAVPSGAATMLARIGMTAPHSMAQVMIAGDEGAQSCALYCWPLQGLHRPKKRPQIRNRKRQPRPEASPQE